MPVLPFINDTKDNIKKIVRKAYECGARFIFAYGMGMSLRSNQREYYYEKLIQNFPKENLVERYMNTYKNNYECPSPNAKKLYNVFVKECEKYGIKYKMKDIIEDYKKKYTDSQLSWF